MIEGILVDLRISKNKNYKEIGALFKRKFGGVETEQLSFSEQKNMMKYRTKEYDQTAQDNIEQEINSFINKVDESVDKETSEEDGTKVYYLTIV